MSRVSLCLALISVLGTVVVVVAAALAATAAGVEVGVAGMDEDTGADAGVAAAYKSVVDYAGLVC